ncbi:glycosyltransferase [Pollutibacter soli]|uniref:glycosyltransferase n=1 Tax=Pollutibacter soli TaxID=3034157 RepID=UPI003014049A
MYTSLKSKKILFANVAADGHFYPLTGLAAYLKELGCDVRWYTSKHYKPKLDALGIHNYPLVKAMDFNEGSPSEIFPERDNIKSPIGKLKFDLINAFILRAPEYYEDILAIRKEFAFELFVSDCMYLGSPFVKELMHVPVISIGVVPMLENSKDTAPPGMGKEPSHHIFGKLRQRIMRLVADKFIFSGPNKVLYKVFDEYGIPYKRETLFDLMVHKPDLYLQSGTPGFEYQRSDLSHNVKFIGSLLPQATSKAAPWYDPRLKKFSKVILVTQGTVEKDIKKLIIPTLEAFKGTEVLVIVTTGGSETEMLRNKYSHENIIIEDYISFYDVMPYADVYVTNGGYGGVMLGIEHQLPMVVAGVHEGKNEIAARIGYFKLGVNLNTETPKPSDIKKAVDKVFTDPVYFDSVRVLSQEFKQYNPKTLFAAYALELLNKAEQVPGTVTGKEHFEHRKSA